MLIAEGKAVAAESLLILRDHQHPAVLDAVARERQAADKREHELRDARGRLERVPVNSACPTPAVLDEAMDIIGGPMTRFPVFMLRVRIWPVFALLVVVLLLPAAIQRRCSTSGRPGPTCRTTC